MRYNMDMSVQRMLPFLLLNIIISAITVIVIWTFFERRQPAVTVVDSELMVNSVQAGGDESVIASAGGTSSTATPEPVVVEATATPEPTGPIIHTVQAGESLGVIAAQYDVTVEDIVTVNELADANSIFQGQQLTIGVFNQSNEVVQPDEVMVEATPTPLPPAEVVIGESTFDISSISGVGDISAEQLLLVNTGPNTVNLSGWQLSNDQGNTFTFNEVTLFGNGAGVTLHSGQGEKTPTDIYWGRESAAWQTGQVIVLRDNAGNLQAEKVLP